MQHQFNRFLAFPLLLVAVSLPLRWGHSHEGMYGQHLSQHLKLFHSPLQNQTLPSGWHSHALIPGMVLKEHDHLFVLNELYENDFYSHIVNEHADLETFDPGIHDFCSSACLSIIIPKSEHTLIEARRFFCAFRFY